MTGLGGEVTEAIEDGTGMLEGGFGFVGGGVAAAAAALREHGEAEEQAGGEGPGSAGCREETGGEGGGMG